MGNKVRMNRNKRKNIVKIGIAFYFNEDLISNLDRGKFSLLLGGLDLGLKYKIISMFPFKDFAAFICISLLFLQEHNKYYKNLELPNVVINKIRKINS